MLRRDLMNKYIKILFLPMLFLLLSAGQKTDVLASTGEDVISFASVEMTEEDLYDPQYYKQPLEDTSSMYQVARVATREELLEAKLIQGLRVREESIDISEFGIKTSEVGTLRTVFYQILNDQLDLFYVGEPTGGGSIRTYVYYTSGDIITRILPYYNSGINEEKEKQIRNQINTATEEALALIPEDEGLEDYEKALIIHDWLVTYCEYDYENYLTDTIPEESHSYGALVNRKAVCDGYAKAYKYILERLGIPSVIVSSDSMNHAWNMVRVDGKYYHVDATWDDPVRDSIGQVMHSNFLRSDAGIREEEHEGWKTDLVAGDAAYDDARWQDSSGSVLYYNNLWYFVDSGAKKLYETKDISRKSSTERELYSFSNSWGYVGAFSYPQRYYDDIIFNDTKLIYRISPGSETKAAEVLFDPECTDGQFIYGLKIDGKTLQYALQPRPNLSESQQKYIYTTELEAKAILGTVEITGIQRYGETLDAPAELAAGLTGKLSYVWYRDGERIPGAGSETYELTKEDIGCVLEVRVSLPYYSGELTARTGRIGKKAAVFPDTPISLNGICNRTLSTIRLPEEYTWKNPGVIMSTVGSQTYIAIYCPDTELYDSREVEVTVTVECDHIDQLDQSSGRKATCMKAGYEVWICVICNRERTEEIPAAGHTWDDGVVEKPASVDEAGIMIYTCTECGMNKTEAIEALKPEDKDPSQGNGNPSDKDPVDKDTPGTGNGGTGDDETDRPTVFLPEGAVVPQTGRLSYQVTQKAGGGGAAGTVAITGAAGVGTVVIPRTVTYDGVIYRVTSIAPKAFKGNKKTRKVTIGANIEKIGAQAFSGCKKLKKITVKSSRLRSVGKKAIKNIHKKAVIKCPKKKKKAYKKLFGAKTGYKKSMKIK